MVPFVIIIGITATDISLIQQMIERGSGVVVAKNNGILFASTNYCCTIWVMKLHMFLQN